MSSVNNISAHSSSQSNASQAVASLSTQFSSLSLKETKQRLATLGESAFIDQEIATLNSPQLIEKLFEDLICLKKETLAWELLRQKMDGWIYGNLSTFLKSLVGLIAHQKNEKLLITVFDEIYTSSVRFATNHSSSLLILSEFQTSIDLMIESAFKHEMQLVITHLAATHGHHIADRLENFLPHYSQAVDQVIQKLSFESDAVGKTLLKLFKTDTSTSIALTIIKRMQALEASQQNALWDSCTVRKELFRCAAKRDIWLTVILSDRDTLFHNFDLVLANYTKEECVDLLNQLALLQEPSEMVPYLSQLSSLLSQQLLETLFASKQHHLAIKLISLNRAAINRWSLATKTALLISAHATPSLPQLFSSIDFRTMVYIQESENRHYYSVLSYILAEKDAESLWPSLIKSLEQHLGVAVLKQFISCWCVRNADTVDLLDQLIQNNNINGDLSDEIFNLISRVIIGVRNEKISWWYDPICSAKLLAKALLCPEWLPLSVFCATDGHLAAVAYADPNYWYQDKIPLLMLALQTSDKDLLIQLVNRGGCLSHIYETKSILRHIENKYGEKFVTMLIDIWPDAETSTGYLVYRLICYNKNELALSLIQRELASGTMQWGLGPETASALFSFAAKAGIWLQFLIANTQEKVIFPLTLVNHIDLIMEHYPKEQWIQWLKQLPPLTPAQQTGFISKLFMTQQDELARARIPDLLQATTIDPLQICDVIVEAAKRNIYIPELIQKCMPTVQHKETKKTMLMHAAQFKDKQGVQYLISRDATLFDCDATNTSAYKYILNNFNDEDLQTIFSFATFKNNTTTNSPEIAFCGVIEALLQDKKETLAASLLPSIPATGFDPLRVCQIICAFAERNIYIPELIQKCMPTACHNATKKTMLMFAAQFKDKRGVQYLISHGATFFDCDATKTSAYKYILNNFSDEDLATIFSFATLKSNTALSKPDKEFTYVIESLLEDKKETLVVSLLQGIPATGFDPLYVSQIIFVAAEKNIFIPELIQKCVPTACLPPSNKTILMCSAQFKDKKAVQYLMSQKAFLFYCEAPSVSAYTYIVNNFNDEELREIFSIKNFPGGIYDRTKYPEEKFSTLLENLCKDRKTALALTLLQDSLKTIIHEWHFAGQADLFIKTKTSSEVQALLFSSMDFQQEKSWETLLTYFLRRGEIQLAEKALVEHGAKLCWGCLIGSATEGARVRECIGQEALTALIETLRKQWDRSPNLLSFLVDLRDISAAKQLMVTLQNTPPERQPQWWKSKRERTKLFFRLSHRWTDEFCCLLEEGIDHSFEYTYENRKYTPLQWAGSWSSEDVHNQLIFIRAGAAKQSEWKTIRRALVADPKASILQVLPLLWNVERKETIYMIDELAQLSWSAELKEDRSKIEAVIRLLISKIDLSSPRVSWFNDPIAVSKLFVVAAFSGYARDRMQAWSDDNLIEPNYVYQSHACGDIPLLYAAVDTRQQSLVVSLVRKGARLYDVAYEKSLFQSVEEQFGSEQAVSILRQWPISLPTTSSLIYHLFVIGKKAEAVAMLEAVQKNSECSWWNDPKEKAHIFCGAARASCRDLARTLVSKIDVTFRDIEDKTPLEYAAELQDDMLVSALLERGALMRYAMGALIANFTSSKINQLITALPYKEESTFHVLLGLYNSRHFNYAGHLFDLVTTQSDAISWMQNSQKLTQLFFAISRKLRTDADLKNDQEAYAKHIRNLLYLSGRVDCFQKDAFQQTPLMHAIALQKPSLIQFFMQQGSCLSTKARFEVANIADTSVDKSTFFFMYHTLGKNVARAYIEWFSLEAKELGTLLSCLVDEGFYEEALSLFRRVESITTPLPGWREFDKTALFLRLLASDMPSNDKESMLEALLPSVNALQRDPQSLNRIALMVASRLHLKESLVVALLQKAPIESLVQKDSEGISGLQYVLENSSIALSNTTLKRCLALFQVSDDIFAANAAHASLWGYLKGNFHTSNAPLYAKVTLSLLCNDTQRTVTYCSTLNFNEFMELKSTIEKCFGTEIASQLTNVAFHPNPVHLQIRVEQDIPPKDPRITLSSILRLYTTFALEQDDKELAVLKQVIHRIEEKTALAKTSSDPLIAVYVRIDNALCHILAHFLEQIEKEQIPRIGLVRTIRSWLKDMIDAASNCGWRLHTHAIEQYNVYVKGRARSIETLFLRSLAMGRMYVAEAVCGNNEQSVHTYNAFQVAYGVELGLPGAHDINSYTDPYAAGQTHMDLAQAARRQFDSDYNARFIFATIRASFEESGAKELYCAFLKSICPTDGDREAEAQIRTKLTKIMQESPEQERGVRIAAYLQRHCISVGATNSVDAIMNEIHTEIAVKQPGWLFLAMQQQVVDGKLSFTDESLFQTLLHMRILSRRQ